MIGLPAAPHRADLRAFCLVLCSLAGLAVAIYGRLSASLAPVLIAWSILAVFVSFGLARPNWILLPYKAWNKVARAVARVSLAALLGIWYVLVVAVVGKTGARFALSPSTDQSGWVRRNGAAAWSSDVPTGSGQRLGWVGTYVSWARGTGNLWAICLLPFLALIAVLAEEEDRDITFFNYTLF